jgi:hypothetical protein
MFVLRWFAAHVADPQLRRLWRAPRKDGPHYERASPGYAIRCRLPEHYGIDEALALSRGKEWPKREKKVLSKSRLTGFAKAIIR